MAAEARSLKIRCATWDQVEAFYARKLKGGSNLAVRVPFTPSIGDLITVALALPNGMVMAIDSRVMTVAPAPDGKKTQISLQLHGITNDSLGRLQSLVADARVGHELARQPGATRRRAPSRDEPPPAAPTDAPIDELIEQPIAPTAEDTSGEEREVFLALEAEHRRLREAPAHEVLGVAWDASVPQVRRGYFRLIKLYHPDRFAKHRSAAVLHLVSEVFIHINKAYDRMREAALAAGQAIVAGPALLPHDGWVAGFEDVADDSTTRQRVVAEAPRRVPEEAPAPRSTATSTPAPPASQPGGGVPVTVNFAGSGPEDAPLSESGLFDDLSGLKRMDEPAAKELSQAKDLFASGKIGKQKADEVARIGQEAMGLVADERYVEARDRLAEALHLDPRNRELRALYHVSHGSVLAAEGKGVDATTQFETALKHDPQCREAREALADATGGGKRRSGMFKRFFQR